MELKTYQAEALEKLEKFLGYLGEAKAKFAEQQETLDEDLLEHAANFPARAWKKLGMQEKWIERKASNGDHIPHVCLKVPTGGGKTLLAAAALAPIHRQYLKRNTGLVLWMVPSKAIFDQTKKGLFDRNHPYRQRIDQSFGNNVEFFTKGQRLSELDVASKLCVMLIMVQASYGKKKYHSSKDFLKIFRTDEKYFSFFPKSGDYQAANELLNQHPDLKLEDSEYAHFQGVSVKKSLVNVFKLLRPVIIMDEGHKAYRDPARKGIAEFNPSLMLELTATPAVEMSNALVNIKGEELNDEQMIKLPIEVSSTTGARWRETLRNACKKRAELERQAKKLEESSGRYIRPIMLIRAERTGKEQRGGKYIHSEDVKEYLQKNEGISEEQVAIKTHELDELQDIHPEDGGLLSPRSSIRFVITKNALKEGWDCPFAYVLALLDNTKAATALTQMVGRTLRQPHARKTDDKHLNRAYVFCHNTDVGKVVEQVGKGLEEEGMKDLRRYISIPSAATAKKTRTIYRRDQFKNWRILLPKVLIKTNGVLDELDYEADLLRMVCWEKLKADCPPPKEIPTPKIEQTAVGLEGQTGLIRQIKTYGGKTNLSFFCRHLSNTVPNPFDTARIMEDLFKQWKATDEEIYNKRYPIIDKVESDLRQKLGKIIKDLFLQKLKSGEMVFKVIPHEKELNHAVACALSAPTNAENPLLHEGGPDKGGVPIQKSLFPENYKQDYNDFEKEVALYMDKHQATEWWWRMVSRRDYALQGWQKEKIYPDFLFCVRKGKITRKLMVTETRSDHLDNEYKKDLLKTLEENFSGDEAPIVEKEALKAQKELKTLVRFPLVLQDGWKEQLEEAIAAD